MNFRKNKNNQSLAEVNASVDTSINKGFWKKLLSFVGPAYLVSVGYMDPGNWATDIAGGSRFGYTLLWVLLMSNLMAMLLQGLSARLGIVRGRDLAQASRETYPASVNFLLYILAEIAIAACDLAEVIGMAIGLQLLFGIPLIVGVSITVLDTFLLLFLLNFGIRKMEAFIIALVAMIGIAFLAEVILAKPDFPQLAVGFIPSLPDSTALYIAIGIIGATVMPHNLYLHSALVQTRKFDRTPGEIKKAIKFNMIDSAVALNLAFFVNAAILVLAASTFFRNGMFNVSEIQDAHQFLQPLLGTKWAPMLFAIALISAGQSSTITGTLAGQIVMEGYLNLRIQPWMRRIITRVIAIVPAMLVIYFMGEQATGKMLILSQVVLSLQLGFAVIPLIHFVSDKKKMGEFAIKPITKFLAWTCAIVIVSLNLKLIIGQEMEWLEDRSNNITLLWLTMVPLTIAAIGFLLYVTFRPLLLKTRKHKKAIPHGLSGNLETTGTTTYKRIAIPIDFSEVDSETIRHALAQGKKGAQYLLVHIVETAGAMMMGNEIDDYETVSDHEHLNVYMEQLHAQGYDVISKLGYGNPKKAIPEIVNKFKPDLLVMGAHGHSTWKDMLFGTTVEAVRHSVKTTVLVVRVRK